MAELTPLFMDIDSVYSGDELGLPYRDIVGEGVVDLAGGHLLVTEKAGTPDLSVDVAAGAAWIAGDTNTDAQPTYRVRNDATVNKGISPDPSNPRKVIIIAQITDETFSGTGRTWEIQALHGTPAASPAEPAVPDSAVKLAVIDVAAAATEVVDADITDSRVAAAIGGGNLSAGGGGGGTDHGLVTALPATPSDGDTCTLTDNLTTGTYAWQFRYVAARASNKWVFIGGGPIVSEVATSESTTSGTYVALTTAGPSIAVPVAGDYTVEVGAHITAGGASGTGHKMSYDIGGTGAVDADGIEAGMTTTTSSSNARAQKKALTAVTLAAKYKASANTAVFKNRWMRLTPIAIGG